MGYRREVVVLLVLSCALGGTAAFASTTCPTAPLGSNQYKDPAFTCTTGAFTFKSFGFNETAGGISPNAILVTPLELPTGIGFLFTGTFNADTNQQFIYSISYFVDPPPPIIRGQQIDLDPTGMVTLQTALCASAFPCPGGQSLGTLTATTASTMAQMSLNPTNKLGVQNTLIVGGNGNAGTSQGFDSITLLTPEPAAILLTASGLVGLLALRFRSKVRQILLQLRS